MKGQAGFWDFEHSLAALSAEGDPLEQLERTVRFERFRPALTKSKALDRLFHKLDQAISDAGYLAMGGRIIDATLVAAPKQRNSDGEKAAIKAGQTPKEWTDKPAKVRQKDRDARWTVKFAKAKPTVDGKPQIDIAIPVFGDKSHISIDRQHGIIRRCIVTEGSRQDRACRLSVAANDRRRGPC